MRGELPADFAAQADAFIAQVLSGLVTGGIYASVALALVMIYSCIGIVGMLLGDIMMVLIDPRISFAKKEGVR